MRYNHFTSANALPSIGRLGLTIGDVPTSIARGKGIVGVWLTTAAEPGGHGLEGAAVDKRRMRLTVEVPADDFRLHRWNDWKRTHVDPDTVRVLEKVAGPAADPAAWRIFLGWIPTDRVVEVHDMEEERPVPDWRGGLPGVEPVPSVAYRDRAAWHRQMLRDVRRVISTARGSGRPTEGQVLNERHPTRPARTAPPPPDVLAPPRGARHPA